MSTTDANIQRTLDGRATIFVQAIVFVVLAVVTVRAWFIDAETGRKLAASGILLFGVLLCTPSLIRLGGPVTILLRVLLRYGGRRARQEVALNEAWESARSPALKEQRRQELLAFYKAYRKRGERLRAFETRVERLGVGVIIVLLGGAAVTLAVACIPSSGQLWVVPALITELLAIVAAIAFYVTVAALVVLREPLLDAESVPLFEKTLAEVKTVQYWTVVLVVVLCGYGATIIL